MTRRATVLLVLGVVLAAALGAAVALQLTDEDDSTTSPSTTSAPVDSSSTSSSTTAAPTADRLTLVVAGEGILGWWDGERWVQAEPDLAVPVEGGERYTVVELDGPTTSSVGGAPSPPPEFCSTPSVALDPPMSEDGQPNRERTNPVAVHGVDDPRPRPTTLLDPDAAVYREAAREQLVALDVADDDVRLAQVVRADLSGDGTDEVLVVAEQIDQDTLLAEPGDYSVVLLRQVLDGEVQTTVVAESRNVEDVNGPSPFLLVSRVSAVADLNGDGTMEVVLRHSYYEGGGTSVYELGPSGALVEVLSAGCGV